MLAQTYQNYEIVLVDDGSSDGTPALVAALSKRHPCIRPFYRANHGLPASRNFAFAEAMGEWIAILDQDDLCYPTRLERQLAVAKENPTARLIFCDVDVINERDEITDQHLPKFHLPSGLIPRNIAGCLLLEVGCYVDSEAFFMHRDSALALGPMDKTLKYACDYEFFIRAGLSFTFAYTPEVLAAWRIHPTQATATFPRVRSEVRVVYRRFIWHSQVPWRTRVVLIKNLLRSIVGQALDALRK